MSLSPMTLFTTPDPPKSPSFIKPHPLNRGPQYYRHRYLPSTGSTTATTNTSSTTTRLGVKRTRCTYITLILILTASLYFLIFASSSSTSSWAHRSSFSSSSSSSYHHSNHHSSDWKVSTQSQQQQQKSSTPSYKLTKSESLAALTSFILSPLHSNSLPIDGKQYEEEEDINIQIENLLDFGLTGGNERTRGMVDEMVNTVWEDEKVVVFGKFRHPPTRVLKALLKEWNLPSPSIIELDTRQDGVVLEQLLKKLTFPTDHHDADDTDGGGDDSWNLPLLIVRGKPITGGVDKIVKLKEEGKLWTN